MAFERHATSKLATTRTSLRIETLGFRGEALPAIAAVAEVEMVVAAAGRARPPPTCASRRRGGGAGRAAARPPARR